MTTPTARPQRTAKPQGAAGAGGVSREPTLVALRIAREIVFGEHHDKSCRPSKAWIEAKAREVQRILDEEAKR